MLSSITELHNQPSTSDTNIFIPDHWIFILNRNPTQDYWKFLRIHLLISEIKKKCASQWNNIIFIVVSSMVSSLYFLKQSSFYVFRDHNYCCESSRLLDLLPLFLISWQNLDSRSYQLPGFVLFSGTYVSHRSSVFNLQPNKN